MKLHNKMEVGITKEHLQYCIHRSRNHPCEVVKVIAS